ncbi:MAG: hypothetical protein K9N06_01705 [Candidatus Cloacimonetes bacterium]|nr:hypothetical protein [Candidatus Cloacimonadota bacterium]
MKYIIYFGIIILLLSGCAYSVYSNSLPHLKTIAISSFENKSGEFELEENIQDFLLNRFDKDGRLRVVTLAPDCILEGTIMDYSRKIDTYDETGIEEYAVKILFRLKFTDLTVNEIIWEKDSLILTEVYSENSEAAEFQSEEEAREAIYEKLFAEFMKNTLEQW